MPSSPVHTYPDAVADVLPACADGTCLCLVADAELLVAVVDALHGADRAVDVDLLCRPAVLDALDDRFVTRSRLRELVDDDTAAVRRARAGPSATTVVAPDATSVLVDLDGGEVATTTVDDETGRRRLRERCRERWAEGTPWTVDAPPYGTLLARAEADLGGTVRSEFETALACDATRDGRAGLGPVARMLVVAARNRRELRSVVEWASATGVASQGTVSRTKRRLETASVVDTEPVRRGVGRPRQRLVLGDDRLRGSSVAELVQTTRATSR